MSSLSETAFGRFEAYGKTKVYEAGMLHCAKYPELNSSRCMNIKYYESSALYALVLAKGGFVSRS